MLFLPPESAKDANKCHMFQKPLSQGMMAAALLSFLQKGINNFESPKRRACLRMSVCAKLRQETIITIRKR